MQNVKRYSDDMSNFGVCSHQSGLVSPAQPSLFQSDEAYRCVTQDVLSSPVSFAHEEKGCTAKVISMEIATSAPDSTAVGWVALGRPWIWPCVHYCHRGKPHPSNKVKHLPEWLR